MMYRKSCKMATVESYAELIKRILREHAQIKPSYGDIAVEVIFDDAQGHYEIMHAGWVGDRRVHGSALHVDLRGGKIWIQHDGTERGVATELLEAGVPASDMVLAFHAPEDRKHTPFATG
jgi:hypothetical protein